MPGVGWRHCVFKPWSEEAVTVCREYGERSRESYLLAQHPEEDGAHGHFVYKETSGNKENLRGRLTRLPTVERVTTRSLYCYYCALQYFLQKPRRLEIHHETQDSRPTWYVTLGK